MTKQQRAARKAVETRQARNRLCENYGIATYMQVKLLSEGMSCADVAKETGDWISSVAATKANLTRGTYDWVGDCNFR